MESRYRRHREMNNFEIILTSYEDAEYLVAEIWLNNCLLAIIKSEKDIQFFNQQQYLDAYLENEFRKTLDMAIRKLQSTSELH